MTPGFDNATDLSLMDNQPARFAKVSMQLMMPGISLENIEHHLAAVTCSASSIRLRFLNREILQQASSVWRRDPTLLFVTSHSECNPSGARLPYVYVTPSSNACGGSLHQCFRI